MAEMTIILRRDPETGKQDIVITLQSDQDALPHEHEQMHRQLVEKVIGKDKVGKVIVERETTKEPVTPVGNAPEQEREKASQKG